LKDSRSGEASLAGAVAGEPAGWKACLTLIGSDSQVLNFGIQDKGK